MRLTRNEVGVRDPSDDDSIALPQARRPRRTRHATGPAEWRRRGSAEVLTIQDVAAYLRLPSSTIYGLVQRRALPGCKVGRQWRFHKTTLEDWLRQGAERARAEQPETTDDGS